MSRSTMRRAIESISSSCGMVSKSTGSDRVDHIGVVLPPASAGAGSAASAPPGSLHLHCVPADSRTPRGPYPLRSSSSGWRSQTRRIGSSTSFAAVCTTRSCIVGMPSGRSPPPSFGIITRRTGWHRYAPGSLPSPGHALLATPRRAGSASPPAPPPRSARTSSRPPPAHLCWRTRARQVIRVAQNVRPPDLVVEQIEPERRFSLALPYSFLCKVRIASGVRRLIANHPTSSASKTHQKSGPLSSTRHYPASSVLRPCPTPVWTDA